MDKVPFPSPRPSSASFPPLRKLSAGELEQLGHACAIEADQAREDSLGKQCERARDRLFLSEDRGPVTAKSVNAVLISLGRAVGQVVSNLECPADVALCAAEGFLAGLVAELEPEDAETVLTCLEQGMDLPMPKKRAGRP